MLIKEQSWKNAILQWAQSGRKIISGADEKTPWQWQVEKDRINIKNKAYISLSIAIRQLQTGDFPDWKRSSFAIKLDKSFINSYSDFSTYYDLNGDYTMFFAILAKVSSAHHRLRSFIFNDLYDSYLLDKSKEGRELLEEIVVLETIKKTLDNSGLSIDRNSITRNFTQPNGNLNSASSAVSASEIANYKIDIECRILSLINEFNKYYNSSSLIEAQQPVRYKHYGV